MTSVALVLAEVQALLNRGPVTLEMALDGTTDRIMQALGAGGPVARRFIRRHLAAMPYTFALPLAQEIPAHLPVNQRRSPWVELAWWEAMEAFCKLKGLYGAHHSDQPQRQ